MSQTVKCDKCGAEKAGNNEYKRAGVERLKKVELTGEVAQAEGVSPLVMETIHLDICPTCMVDCEERMRKSLLAFFGMEDDKA